MDTQAFDQSKAEVFAGRMMGLLNGSFVSLMASIGHRTGLFDTLQGLPPATSEEIATAAGLQERYVREWLGGMTVGGILEHDPVAGTYRLPPEHAAFLTREAGMKNLAFQTQFVGLVAQVEHQVVECFRNGGGVPYSAFPEFQRLQGEESAALYGTLLVDTILPLAAGVVERLQEGIDVADLGCGQGRAVNVMAKAFPRSRFTGFDFSAEGVEAGRSEAAAWGLENATFDVCDVAAPAGLGSFDLITAFDCIHDLAQPRVVLANIAQALRPAGTFLMMDIAAHSSVEGNMDHPAGPLLYGVSVFHCMAVSLAQGGEGLGTAWGEQEACRMLEEAGFASVEVSHLDGDPMHAFYVAKP